MNEGSKAQGKTATKPLLAKRGRQFKSVFLRRSVPACLRLHDGLKFREGWSSSCTTRQTWYRCRVHARPNVVGALRNKECIRDRRERSFTAHTASPRCPQLSGAVGATPLTNTRGHPPRRCATSVLEYRHWRPEVRPGRARPVGSRAGYRQPQCSGRPFTSTPLSREA